MAGTARASSRRRATFETNKNGPTSPSSSLLRFDFGCASALGSLAQCESLISQLADTKPRGNFYVITGVGWKVMDARFNVRA